MKSKDNNTFDSLDSKFREVLKNAEEPVPEMVWAKVSNRLDVKATPVTRRFPMWWTAGLSTAAAILAGVLIFTHNNPQTSQNQPLLAMEETTVAIEDFTESIPDNITETFLTKKATPTTEASQESDVTPENKVLPKNEVVLESEVLPESEIIPESEVVPESEDVKEEQKPAEEEIQVVKQTDQVLYAQAIDNILEKEQSPKAVKSNRKKLSLDVYGNMMASTGNKPNGKRPMKTQPTAKPTETGVTETGQSKFSIPVTLGLGIKYPLTERWAIGAGINYSIMGREFPGIYSIVENGKLMEQHAFEAIKNNQSYIGANINLYFSFIHRRWVDFYAYLGGGFDSCIHNQLSMFDNGNKYSHNDKKGGCQWNTKLGIGVEFIAGDLIGIYLDPSATWYIPTNNVPKSIRTKHQILPAFEIGLRFRI